MTRTEILKEIDDAFNEVVRLIDDSSEHNQFNHLYFEPKFKKWFAEKLDDLEEKKT